jgi:hypothetical protein
VSVCLLTSIGRLRLSGEPALGTVVMCGLVHVWGAHLATAEQLISTTRHRAEARSNGA